MLKNLFADAPPDRALGHEIRIDGATLMSCSAYWSRWVRLFGFSRDNVVYIPYSTYQKAYGAGARSSRSFRCKLPTSSKRLRTRSERS
jgi:hypothetical protein